jgi:hypothetical protein
MMKKLVFILVTIVVFGLGISARAELVSRGRDNLKNNLVYDTDLNVTWYDYSYSASEYQDAVSWANNLSVKIGINEFTDWRLPSTINGKSDNVDSPHHTEMGHLYLSDLVNNEVMHPWRFPDNWRNFDRLAGGYYWMLQTQDRNGMGKEGSRDAPVYNSIEQKLQLIPVSSVNRPKDSWYNIFGKKKKYLGVAVHPGDILRKH